VFHQLKFIQKTTWNIFLKAKTNWAFWI